MTSGGVWRVIWRSLLIRFKLASRSQFQIASILVMPAIQSTVAVYIFRAGEHPVNLLYAAIGGGYVSMWSAMLFEGGTAVERERWSGTLELLVSAPAPILSVLSGITTASTLAGGYALMTTIGWGWLVLGVPVHVAAPLVFATAIVIAVIGLGALGLVFAAWFALSRNTFSNALAIETPSWLICGLFVPITILPGWVHPFSYVLTPTWGAEAMRRAVDGRSAATALLISAALSLVYVALAVQLMRMVERRARVTGSLALA